MISSPTSKGNYSTPSTRGEAKDIVILWDYSSKREFTLLPLGLYLGQVVPSAHSGYRRGFFSSHGLHAGPVELHC